MLKLYVALFIEKNNDGSIQEQFDNLCGKYMNKASAFVLTISALVFPVMGFLPGTVMGFMADFGQISLAGYAAAKDGIPYFPNPSNGSIGLYIWYRLPLSSSSISLSTQSK